MTQKESHDHDDAFWLKMYYTNSLKTVVFYILTVIKFTTIESKIQRLIAHVSAFTFVRTMCMYIIINTYIYSILTSHRNFPNAHWYATLSYDKIVYSNVITQVSNIREGHCFNS